MKFKKIAWMVRAFLWSFFTDIKMPSYIGKPLYINKIKNIKFGKKVRIYPGIRAEIVDKKGEIILGNNVSIGQNLHIVSNDEKLKIGNNVVISGNVFITNCDHQYTDINKYLFEQPLITKKTEIGDNCFIGYGAVIQAGTILGRNCIVGANSVVRGNFEENSVIVGAPAKVIKKYNNDNKKWERIK